MNNTNDDSIISKTNIIDVNADTFMTDVIEASKEKPIIVDFWAPWCEPCKQLTPLLENAVKDQREKLTLAKIDIDQNQDIAAQLRIQSIPTVYTFFEGIFNTWWDYYVSWIDFPSAVAKTRVPHRSLGDSHETQIISLRV